MKFLNGNGRKFFQMEGNDKVNTLYILAIVISVIIYYGLLMNGWGERIEWLQSLSPGYDTFLPAN